VVNQPIVRGTITIQDPGTKHPNLTSALSHIYRTRGAAGLWHGTGASVMKTVPKYVTAIWVKDAMQDLLPKPTAAPGEPGHRAQVLRFSAIKSVAAGVAGAALTNPLDVIRNEMFKTDESTVATTRRLLRREGLAFVYRGMGRNLVAVAAPIGTCPALGRSSGCAYRYAPGTWAYSGFPMLYGIMAPPPPLPPPGMTIFLTDAIVDWRLSLSAERARGLPQAVLGLPQQQQQQQQQEQERQPPPQRQRAAPCDRSTSMGNGVAGAVLRRVSTGSVPEALSLPHMIATSNLPASAMGEEPAPLQREV
jgi:hypothetical protein